MPYLQDKDSKHYWKEFGEGLTEKLEEAQPYSMGQAGSLLRIFWETTDLLVNNEPDPGLPPVWIVESYQPDPRATPFRTQQMKDKNLIWVRLDDVWLATDVQSLTMASLLVLNATTPHTREHEPKRNRRKTDNLAVVPDDLPPAPRAA